MNQKNFKTILSIIKEEHTINPDSQYFKNDKAFSNVFDILYEGNRIELFRFPDLPDDDQNVEYIKIPPSISIMIEKLEYIQLDKVNPKISPESLNKIFNFYSYLGHYAKEQGHKLADCVTSFLEKENNVETITKVLESIENVNSVKNKDSFNLDKVKSFIKNQSAENPFVIYKNNIENFCNFVGLKNETTLEEEYKFMDEKKRAAKILTMKQQEIYNVLNQNSFSFILKSISFVSHINQAQGDLEGYSHSKLDEINKSIFNKLNCIKDNLVKKIEEELKEINNNSDKELTIFRVDNNYILENFQKELKDLKEVD